MGAKKKPIKKQPRTAVLKLIVLYASLIVASALVAATYAIQQKTNTAQKPATPFTSQQITTTSFTLYYPGKLPAPLRIDQPADSARATGTDIIQLRVADGLGSTTNRSLTITQQSLPQHFNITAFTDGMDNKRTIPTAYGQATAGTVNLGQNRLAILVTDDRTLLLVQLDAGATDDDLQQVLQNLKRVIPPTSAQNALQ